LRARAAVQLGYLGNEAAIPALLTALGDEQLDVRLGAAQALVQMRHAAAVGPILRALALPGRWPLQRATELLYGFGQLAVLPLRQLLADRTQVPTPAMQAVALNVLGMLGAREAAPEVLGWLEHVEPELRVAAARALGGMRDPSTGAALARALRDDAWEVRSTAAKALGQLHERSAIVALDAALADPVWWVRYNAAQALAELGADGLDALRRAMTTQDDAFARDISRQMLEERNPRAQEVTP
jgi:HEAT repeat protein